MERKRWGTDWVYRAVLLMFADILIVLVSYFLALLMRFDFRYSRIPGEYIKGYLLSMPIWVVSTLIAFYACKLYHSIWRLASVSELRMLLTAYLFLAVVYAADALVLRLHMPLSYYFMGYIICFCCTTGIRFSYRLLRLYLNRRAQAKEKCDRIMIIGAGAAGQMITKELLCSDKVYARVCCIIDDNPNKKGRVLEGIPIVGNRYDIPEMVAKYEINHIIFAIPTLDGKNRKEILNICKDTGCELQTVPGYYQLVNGEVSVSKLRKVEITDLLGRAQVKVNNEEIFSAIEGKIVLVTGGGRLDRQ